MTTNPKPRPTYRPHFQRTPKPYHFQARDALLLQTLGENRFLTKDIFLLFFPPDPDKTPQHVQTETPHRTGTNLERRLAELYHHGYLMRWRKELRGPLIYALANKGAELLRTKQLPLFSRTDWTETNRDLSHAYIDHTLMGARFRASLAAALRVHPAVSLFSYEWEAPDLKASWKHGGMRIYVNPDSFFTLKDASQPPGQQFWSYFLEADQSTMTLERMLEKYARYSLMFADKQHQEQFDITSNFPHVLTVAKSRERAANLAALLAEATTVYLRDPDSRKPYEYRFPREHRKFFYFTTEETYQAAPTNALANIWRRADDLTELRAVIASPLPRS